MAKKPRKIRVKLPPRSKQMDILVGIRLKLRREILHISERDLAGRRLKISVATLRRYERGQTRIPARELDRISRILDVPVLYFFEDIPKK